MATKAPKSGYPPSNTRKDDSEEATNRFKYWGEQISKADKRFDTFLNDGDAVVNRFMLESKNVGDKYNILYSSTETIKPSLYGQTPKVQAKNKQIDTEDSLKVASAMLLEQVGQYAVDNTDFDYVLKNIVADYVLPGLGVAWVRYEPSFSPMYSNDNKPETNEDGTPREYLASEKICLDYVFWKDLRWGSARVWEETPWVARKVYFTRKQADKRFGSQKAGKLAYTYNMQDRKDRQYQDNPKRQAIIWEIWDREAKEVIWYSDDYADDVLDRRDDPLRLEHFYPLPRPLRAVWATRDFIPKALYSQYKAQAAELDRLTERIRYLTEALKVRGLYDGSQENLANLLEGPGNKMIAVQDWAQFIGQNGVQGSVQWVPIEEVVNVLTQLFNQREICKNEIYEITGFSDIVRGVSKASETLGAQQIKADWATGRLKDMQREVQRFCRDIIRLFVEIAAEHFSEQSLLLYSGLTIPKPKPEEMQAQQAAMQQGMPPPPTQADQVKAMFQAVVKLVRQEKLRCAAIDVETDSTILPDEEKERNDRMMFLNSMGAFLQQAGPMALQYPDMRGLLGGIMMFTLRTFSSSRPLEKEFETFQRKLEQMPPTPPPGQDGGKSQEASAQISAESQKAVASLKAQSDQTIADKNNQAKQAESSQRLALESKKADQDHEYRMAQLALDRQRVELDRKKVGLGVLQEERMTANDEADAQYQRDIAGRTQADDNINQERDREENRVDIDIIDAREHRKLDIEDKKADAAKAAAKAKPKAKGDE